MKIVKILIVTFLLQPTCFAQISDFELDNDGWLEGLNNNPIADFSSVSCNGFLMYRGNSSDFQQSISYAGFSTNTTSFIGFNRADGSCVWEEMVALKPFTISSMTTPTFKMDHYIGNTISSANLFVSISVQYNDNSSSTESINSYTLNSWTNLEYTLNPPAGATIAEIVIDIGGSDAAGFDNIGMFDAASVGIENNHSDDTFQVSPNPVNQILNVTVDNSHLGKNDYIISSLEGKIVLSGVFESEKTAIDLSSLESGVYIISLHDGVAKKIVKQ